MSLFMRMACTRLILPLYTYKHKAISQTCEEPEERFGTPPTLRWISTILHLLYFCSLSLLLLVSKLSYYIVSKLEYNAARTRRMKTQTRFFHRMISCKV